MSGPRHAGRIPPHAIDAEQAVLGAMLLEGRAGMDKVLDSPLVSDDFFLGSHREIYSAMKRLYDADQGVDLITVSEDLRKTGNLETAGGPAALALLMEHASMLSHLEAYIGIVVEHGKRRHLIETGTKIVSDAYATEYGADELLGRAQAEIEKVAARSLKSPYDPAAVWDRMVKNWKKEGAVLTLGLARLDRLTGGISRGDVMVVGARTSYGKTSFSANRACALARQGIRVEMLTLEETEEGITRRLIASLADVELRRLRSGDLNPLEFDRAQEAVAELQTLPLVIRGVEAIRGADERTVIGAISVSRADVVMLDHLQKVEPKRYKGDDHRTYAIQRIMDRLHTIGLRDRKLVWINVQLNPPTDGKKQRPPALSDIRDSRSVENAARQVLLLFWPWKLKQDRPMEDYEIHVAKNSEGGTGKVEVRFHAPTGRFTDD